MFNGLILNKKEGGHNAIFELGLDLEMFGDPYNNDTTTVYCSNTPTNINLAVIFNMFAVKNRVNVFS